MITFQKYTEILRNQGVSKEHYLLTDLIYSKGEEKITEPLTKRLGEIINRIDEKNYSTVVLNDFTKNHLGIEGPVLKRRDFSNWEGDN